jgi:hypothetical protein
MYNWIVLLHVLSVMVFLMVHGVALAVSFQIRAEKNLERARGLLELSASMYAALYPALVLILLTGIVLAFMGNWWHQGWIWAALILFVVEVGAMSGIARRDYLPLRRALGLRLVVNGRVQPAAGPSNEAEALALLEHTHPDLLAAIGGVGLVLIFWLMILKPF